MNNDKDGVCPCWGTDKEVERLRAELESAKRENAQLAAAFTIGQDEFRYCQFCGCLTNARLRRCCDKGTKTDLSKSTTLRDLLLPTIELLKNPVPCPNFGVQKKWGSVGPREHPVEITTTIPMKEWLESNIGKPCGWCPVCRYNKQIEAELTRLRELCAEKGGS